MISGENETNLEPAIVLLFISQINDEMISGRENLTAFSEMLERLLGYGVLPLFLATSGAAEVFSRMKMTFVTVKSQGEWSLLIPGDIWVAKYSQPFLENESALSVIEIIEQLEDNGNLLIINSFLLEPDAAVEAVSGVIASPDDRVLGETGWEKTYILTDKPALTGWLQWGEQMLRGIEHQASRLRWNKSRMERQEE